MKIFNKLVIGLAIFCSHTALAEVIWQKSTTLNLKLKALIQSEVAKRCPTLFGVTEISTTNIEHSEVKYFETHLSGQFYFDGMHPTSVDIYVSTATDAVEVKISKFLANDSEACN